ncbi:glycoside hydrolase family 3 N-terminal domain-containing protein [Agromyces agglutinans]|uniref:glycoside hydrolase family 3 N-terminal domain-containing protein n=1 Tax=Agromyces agglutinans TaxID=2662258 RepID=UPI0028ABC951|nr:glycoside hydrolase family 3 N-terminal domain-containing protein [Agromyces agglutinans]
MSVQRFLGAVVVAAVLAGSGCAAGGVSSGATDASSPAPSPRTPSPAPAPVDPVAAWVETRLASMTLEQKAAALLMVHAPGTDPAPLRTLVEQGVSGLILMGDNIPASPEQLAALTGAVQVDPEARTLIGIDEEGGIVQRLPWDDAAAAPDLRALAPADAEAAFARRGDLLAQSGIDVNFGIVADVTGDANSFISDRVLGTDPASAADRVAAAVAGEAGRAGSTLKHFPGHGAAPGDSHASVPVAPLTIDEWRAGPALPFSAGIEAGADLVMTGHLAYPAVDAAPASLSAEWHRILREELGFDGVVVSDDMLMLQHNGLAEYADPGENAVRAVAAGTDLLLYVLPADPSTFGISVAGLSASIAEAVRSGRIPEARLDEAATRVLSMRREAVLPRVATRRPGRE